MSLSVGRGGSGVSGARTRYGADAGGFTLIELLLVVTIIAILTIPAAIFFTSFLTGQKLKGAAQQVTTLLNEARQIAITKNSAYRVEVDTATNTMRFVRTSNGVVWTGAGTDGQGYKRLENEARITAVSVSPPSYIIFNPLGTASGGNITVQASEGGQSMRVVVSSAGRIRQCTVGTAGCP